MANFPNTGNEPIPPGATNRAADRPTNPRGDVGDKDAIGTPAGGTSYGGLGGTNVDEGSPNNAPLEAAMGDDLNDNEGGEDTEAHPPYAGMSGGAVGGTPAEDRATGGNIHGGLAPGGVHRGDSTIGSNAPTGRGMSKEEAQRRAGKR